MSVFLPTCGIGNSLALATFGGTGEIMGFFYPHLDFAQNVREGMHGVHLHDGSEHPFLWCFADCFDRSQVLLPNTNVLVSTLRHRDLGLVLEVTDLLPPGEHALLRRVKLTLPAGHPPVSFMQYFHLAVGDGLERNAVHHVPESRAVVQHFRDICLAVAVDREFRFQAGANTADGVSQTKAAMAQGSLNGSHQAMGNVDFAVAVEGDGAECLELALVLAGGRRLHEAAANARRLADIPFDRHRQAVDERCRAILARAQAASGRPHRQDAGATGARLGSCPDLVDAYARAVLVLHDLYDEETHAFVAAPEFDPGYKYSGGYGYCWPRDAAVVGLVAARMGFTDQTEAFFDWAARCQLPDGHWFQRYWVDGTEAPSWCVQHNELQLDQTCAVLHAAAHLADLLGGTRRAKFVKRFREPAHRAAGAIIRHVGGDGLHLPAADLWECCHGSFPYTQAAVIAALRDGQRVFDTPNVEAEALRAPLFGRLWNSETGCWLRRIDPQGNPDPTLDSSCLGLIYPWEVLDLGDPQARNVAQRTVWGVIERLGVQVRGGRAILRFENESYMGGGAGCVNTLWAALCCLRLAAAAGGDRQHLVDQARALIGVALANTNPTGQLPELIPKMDFGYWAAPHGWASALLIECVLALAELSHSTGKRR